MAQVGSYYVDLDVPTEYLITQGATVQFDLTKECCGGGDAGNDYCFYLTRAVQCNGSQLALPLVCFEKNENKITMKIDVPLLLSDPVLVSCARTSLRVEYF